MRSLPLAASFAGASRSHLLAASGSERPATPGAPSRSRLVRVNAEPHAKLAASVSERRPCRLLVDSAASGAWNMAVDEALLEHTRVIGTPVLRLYRWQEATLSLGYFQSIAEAKRFADRPIVRRLSGGGAILHHHEITYSLCLPPGHPLAVRANDVYRAVHEGIAAALKELGVPLHRRAELPLQEPSTLNPQLSALNEKPFLCFLRESCDDLVLRGSKIVGSAQRRRRGALLQHGSLILSTSPHASEVVGLQQLASGEFRCELDGMRLAAAILSSLGLSPLPGVLEESETAQAVRLAESKYLAVAWNSRR